MSDGGRGRGRPPGFDDAETFGRQLVTKPKRVSVTSTPSSDPGAGRAIQLMANFVRVVMPSSANMIYDYHVDFDPPMEQHRVRRALMWEQKELLGEAMMYDGDHNVKLLKNLPDEVTEIKTKDKKTEGEVKIVIKRTGNVDWSSPELMRLLAVQARRNLQHLNYILLGRHFFDPTTKKRVQEQRIEIWQGIQTALHNYDGGVMLMSETVHKVVRGETAAENMQRIFKNSRETFQESCRQDMVNAVVMTSYNQKTYKITDIAFDKNPLYEFEKKGVKMSIKQYYQDRYNVTINDGRQPLLVGTVSGKKQRGPAGQEADAKEREILLVPSLCQMTGLSEAQQNDMMLRRNMIKLTQADPSRKVEELRKFISDMHGNNKIKEEMSRWSVTYDTDIVSLDGKVLPNEILFMEGQGKQAEVPFKSESADFSRETRGKGMRQPSPPLKKWAVLVSGRDNQLVNDFTSTLKRVMTPMGCQVENPTVVVLENDRPTTYLSKLQSVPKDIQMVVSIVPNNSKDRYDAIKKTLTCESGIPSQVIQGKTLSNKKMLMSCVTKVGIQMAVKLGAQPWIVKIPPANLMVIALTCYKDSQGQGQEAAAMVATTNPTLSTYYSRVQLVKTLSESLADVFASNIAFAFKKWAEVNGKLPERVIIYRDADSEGQIPNLYKNELPRIRQELEKISDYFVDKGWCYTLLHKRVGPRFFTAGGRANNPPPGTVVDTVITRKERFDFYLVSQATRQGTVGPIMFNIFEDLTGFKPVHHQSIAYKLTHLYYNWPGMVKIPAPCQYAYKLAYQTGTHLHREPNEKLNSLLFFL